jgi:LPXTG-site transpeptidase (sortase) family protein
MKAKLLLTFGFVFVFLTASQLWQRFAPITQTPSSAIASTISPSDPFSIDIPSLNISLPVYKATLADTTWEYTSRGVSYLSSSAIPGTPGNTIMYGHNWPNLLGALPKIKTGAAIIVRFRDGSHKTFSVNTSSTVPASQTDILNPTADTRLTLFTCIGFLDSQRFVVVARL